MNEPIYVPIYVNDGCVVEPDYVYVTARYERLDPARDERSIGLARVDGRWSCHADLDYNVISACYFEPDPDQTGELIALSMHGEVHSWDPRGETEQTIAGAGSREPGGRGPLTQIRQIGASLFACGSHGQVYRRSEAGWDLVDETILDPARTRALWLNGLGGAAEDELLVVGYHGRILRFDGRRFDELAVPTNVHLERVWSSGPGLAYVCGNYGTLLRITPSGIDDLSIDTDEHFWGLAGLDGRIYACSLSTIYALDDDDQLRELDTGLGPEVGFYRLDSKGGALWSFGAHDLIRFDGQAWTRHWLY